MSRGMKKFLPYASLIEQGEFVNQMLHEKQKVSKPLLSYDDQERINLLLTNYNDGKVIITYFQAGYIYRITTYIKRIDPTFKELTLVNFKLSFADVIDIIYAE